LQLLSNSQYHALCTILPHLNQWDINSLRSSCETFRNNLPATSQRLGGVFQSRHSDTDVNGGLSCMASNPFNNSRLFACPEYYSSPEEERERDHKEALWQCQACFESVASSEVGFGPLDDSTGNGLWCEERLVQICQECFEKPSTEATAHDVPPSYGPCLCEHDFKARSIRYHYCPYCANKAFH
jgi:hypothetical protein